MDYNLAKQLKDAGFPQNKSEYIFNENGQRVWKSTKRKYFFGCVDCPTLEELIEACGTKFAILSYSPGKETIWVAAARYLVIGEIINGNGSTPTIAVANLWLALNPKKA